MRSDMLTRYPMASSANATDFLHALRRMYATEIRPIGRSPSDREHVLRGINAPDYSIGYIRSGLGVEIAGPETKRSYFVDFGVSGLVYAERHGERTVNTSARAAVFNPGDRRRLLPARPGTETLGIRLDRALVETELAALLGREPDGPIAFDLTLGLTGADHSGLRIMVESLIDQLDTGSKIFDHPAVRQAHLRSFVTGLLLTHRHNYSEPLLEGHTPLRSRPLRRALDFIDRSLGDPITLSDLAQAGNCSARTLSDAFREHFGCSPMAFLRDRRLERVRADLLAGSDRVGTVAHRWGFTHMGRFAAAYQHRYGELPSATAARE
ncbi:AraC family transcriptional regulator [Streptomyces sp. NPDC002405]